METICIEYDVTKKDYINYVEHGLKVNKSWVWRLLPWSMAFFAGCFLIIELMIDDAPAYQLVISLIALLVGSVLLGVVLSRRSIANMTVRNRLRRGGVEPQYFGRHRLELDEDSLEMRYGIICVRRFYAGIYKIEEYPHGIAVYYSQSEVDIIPHTAFCDVRQRGEFFYHLQARLSQAKDVGMSKQAVEEHKQSSVYVLEYAWDEPGFVAAMVKAGRLMFKTRLGWSAEQIICTYAGLVLWLAGIMSLIPLFTLTGDYERQVFSWFGFTIVGFFFLMTPIVTFTPLANRMYRKRINNGAFPRDFFSPLAFCFKEDKITTLNRLNSVDMMYDRVYCVRHDADGMCLLLKGKVAIVIPDSAFSSDDQKREIAEFIERKIKRSKTA